MKKIDLSRIIRESDNKFLKKLPDIVIFILRKIIHEKEMNRVLDKFEGTQGKVFLDKMIEELNLKLDITGLENLPQRSKCIFAANHPFGVVDGLIITHTVSSKYGHLQAIGNDAFMFVEPLRPFIFSVNVYGTNTKERIAALDNLYASDTPITHFPSGEVSRKYHGTIQDRSWHKSFVTKAIQHKRDIVPIHFKGKNSGLFYFISSFRKLLGIKLTLELILLPHEIFNKKGKKLQIIIGKPISWQILDKRHSYQEWTDKIRTHTYKLSKEYQEFIP